MKSITSSGNIPGTISLNTWDFIIKSILTKKIPKDFLFMNWASELN